MPPSTLQVVVRGKMHIEGPGTHRSLSLNLYLAIDQTADDSIYVHAFLLKNKTFSRVAHFSHQRPAA